MEQVVEKFPSVLGLALENMKAKVEFLLNEVGVSEAKLGKVRYCLLFAYIYVANTSMLQVFTEELIKDGS